MQPRRREDTKNFQYKKSFSCLRAFVPSWLRSAWAQLTLEDRHRAALESLLNRSTRRAGQNRRSMHARKRPLFLDSCWRASVESRATVFICIPFLQRSLFQRLVRRKNFLAVGGFHRVTEEQHAAMCVHERTVLPHAARRSSSHPRAADHGRDHRQSDG